MIFVESETDRMVLSHSYKFVVHDLETCESTRQDGEDSTSSTAASLYDYSKGDILETTDVATVTTYAEQKKILTALMECHLKATAPSQTPGYTDCGVAITALIPPGC